MMLSNQRNVPLGDLRMYVASPNTFIKSHPTSKSVRLGCEYIDLSRLALALGKSPSYLSRIMLGSRTPRNGFAQAIAKALGMGLKGFLDAIKIRKLSGCADGCP